MNVTVTQAFKFLRGYLGNTSGTAEFFGVSDKTIDVWANATDETRNIHARVNRMEDETGLFPHSFSRFRNVLQALNDGDHAEDVGVIHAALMRMKARDPEQFGPRRTRPSAKTGDET